MGISLIRDVYTPRSYTHNSKYNNNVLALREPQHQKDDAVYGSESACVTLLMKLYQDLTGKADR